MGPNSIRILIAGSNGIIGSYLHNDLKMIKNIELFSLDKNLKNSDMHFKVDCTIKESIISFGKSIPNFDVLIYLVALAHEKGKAKDYKSFELINYQTLVNLLGVLKESNKVPKQIIFSSTISVYGERYNETVYSEVANTCPKSPYAITKLKAEEYLIKYYKDISWILRFAPVYSNEFILNIKRRTIIKNMFYRVGRGDNKLSLLSIKNILTVIKLIMNGQIPPGIYNLSDKREYTFRELLIKQKASRIIFIPKFVVKSIYYINKLIGNVFINENTIKLLTDNIYPSSKLRKHTDYNDDLDSTL